MKGDGCVSKYPLDFHQLCDGYKVAGYWTIRAGYPYTMFNIPSYIIENIRRLDNQPHPARRMGGEMKKQEILEAITEASRNNMALRKSDILSNLYEDDT